MARHPRPIQLKAQSQYEYDPRGHLIRQLFSSGEVLERQSDPAGNLFKSRDRSDRTYGPGGVIQRANGTDFEVDADGFLTKKTLGDGAVWKYVWDAHGQLTEVVRPDKKTVTFTYDAFGRRTTKTFDGNTTEYVWDGDDLVHERVRDASGALSPVTTWVFEPGTFTPLAKLEGRKRYGIVSDHLGSPAMLATEAGKIAWRAQLDIYGVPREEEGVAGDERTDNPWRFPGQYEDKETGLYYNRFRYYDPELGRYLSEDPIGLRGGEALFGYVADPLWWLDPFGLTACGRRGERAARKKLEKEGFEVLGSVQNKSGHGIDLVARDKAGGLWFFEVKTSAGTKAPSLSKAQKNGPAFVLDRLERAATGDGHWGAVADPATASKADALLQEARNTGFSTGRVNVTEGNGNVEILPW